MFPTGSGRRPTALDRRLPIAPLTLNLPERTGSMAIQI